MTVNEIHPALAALTVGVGLVAGVVALGAMAAVISLLVRSSVNGLGRRLGDGWTRFRGGVPWLPGRRQLSLLGATHSQHTTAFVSRHHLAEGGLSCPLCQTRVADAGDFSRVYRVIADGRENECMVCTGERELGDGRMVPCGTLLLASPDTEHGDHLNDAGAVDGKGTDPPSYYLFVRVGAEQALREKWGMEIASGTDGDLVAANADAPTTTSPPAPTAKE